MDVVPECVDLLLNENFNPLQRWVSYLNPKCLWALQPVYMLTQILILFGGFITLFHAYTNGTTWMYRWFSIAITGFIMELFSYLVSSINSFWHSQSSIMFLEGRLPFHILFVYPVFYYTAMVRVSLMRLSKWAKPFAVAIVAVLMDIPYDIVGIKFLQWSWHDTDPNIYDRHYWVPWTSYYFHGVLSAIIFIITTGHWIDLFLSSVIAIPTSFVAFGIFYHPLHDYANVHTEIVVIVLLTIFLTPVLVDLTRLNDSSSVNLEGPVNSAGILRLFLISYYAFFMIVVLIFKPEDQISVGLHQPIGPCDTSEPVYTMSGKIKCNIEGVYCLLYVIYRLFFILSATKVRQLLCIFEILVLRRNVYLCIDNYDEGYFDFHCLHSRQRLNRSEMPISWYVICGTPFPNIVEYVVIMSAICVLSVAVFYDMPVSLSLNNAIKNKLD